MKSYSTFHFSSYSWNHHAGKISLKYALDKEHFFEELIFLPEPISDEHLEAKKWEIERLLFALHIIGGISYFKTFLPRTMNIHSGDLDLHEARFWNTVYEKGLGEFFYKNNIDFRGLINFPVQREKVARLPAMRTKPLENRLKRMLVPIGGGKDSMVTIELLRKTGADITLLRLEPHPIIDELSHAAGLPMLTVERQLSSTLFELNDAGALNGHIPITAYLSILSALLAVLYDFDAVVMSNESSANVGNVEFKGLQINHQWSKSVEFERMFRKFLSEAIGTNTEYFSALRPFSELKITQIFSKYPEYFERVTSCNANWKISGSSTKETVKSSKWCKKCPKCAFVFACMSAFLEKTELEQMFGANLFSDDALVPLFEELLGIRNFKPFECVGTPEETQAAFVLAHRCGEHEDTPVMKMFASKILKTIKDPDRLINEILAPSKEHFIPKILELFILSFQ